MVRVDLNQLSQLGSGTKSSPKRTDSKMDRTDFSDLLSDRVSEDRETASQETEKLQDKKPISQDKKPADDKDNGPVSGKDENPAKGPDGKPSEDGEQTASLELLVQLQNSIQYTGMMGQTQTPAFIEGTGEIQAVQDAEIQILNEMEHQGQIQETSGQMVTEGVQSMEQMIPAAEDGAQAEMLAEGAADAKASQEPVGEQSVQEPVKGLAEEGLLEKPAKAETRQQSFDSQDTLEGQSQPAGESMYQTVSKPQGMDTLFRQMDVKSAMNPETVSTSPETFAPDIGKALAARIPEQNGTLTIELEPASLGKLTIHVVYESDRATVSISASNPKTLELLNQNAVEIAHIMEEKTGQQTTIYVPESQEQMDARTDEQGHKGHDRDQEEPKHKDQSEAFAQRLRLGLI